MPHAEINCYPGRTEEQKKKCAEKIAQDIAEILGCPASSVSVAIREVEKDNWKQQVWDAKIIPSGEELYVKPGYTCD